MDLYSIRNQRISPNEEFPLLCFRSASKECHARAERHTEKRKVLEEKKVDSLKLGKFVLLAIVPVLA